MNRLLKILSLSLLTLLLQLMILPAAVAEFIDVPAGSAVDYLLDKQIVNGYADGTFKPNQPINRAEFTKIVVNAFAVQANDRYQMPFKDVPADAWYYEPVWRAASKGIVSGDSITAQFFPDRQIAYSEAMKVIVLSSTDLTPDYSKSDTWYAPYQSALQTKGYGLDIAPDALLNRGQMALLVAEMLGYEPTEAPVAEVVLTSTSVEPVAEQVNLGLTGFCPSNNKFDDPGFAQYDKKLQEIWLGWYNEERAKRGFGPLSYSESLSRTAYDWAEESKRQGAIGHRRTATSAYYDYYEIKAWFQARGVTFGNRNRITFTENLGRAYITCDLAGGGCEEQLISGMRTVIDMFLGEESWASRPHFDPFINPNFDSMGMGLSYNPATKQLYVVAHFGVEVKDNQACVASL